MQSFDAEASATKGNSVLNSTFINEVFSDPFL